MASTGEFRLSITKALSDQLAAALDKLAPAPLVPDEVGGVAQFAGVYQLYLRGDLVYIGKADRSLRERLTQHMRKLGGRENISLADMSFTALYVDEDLSAVAPETLLINRYRSKKQLPWNYNGFGNKDPGKERDTSKVESEHFDAMYPANLDVQPAIPVGKYLVGDLLARLKSELPYVFRYQDGSRKKDLQPAEYWDRKVEIDEPDLEVRYIFQIIADEMPGWQITALPGYVIMYKQQKKYLSQREVFTPEG